MKQQIILDNFGTLQLFLEGQDYYWFGNVKNISPDNKVELTINVDTRDKELTTQTKLISDLAGRYDKLMTMLYGYIRDSFTKDNKTTDELKKMYFLTDVELKKNNKDWWIVLEPMPDVETIYNHFLRFTVSDDSVTWSNFE
ncbi:MAG TPA: hypothetical protein VL443_14415 [Cyclobacteriaceae bacterium]|jgi:hypothetical protein|nr:hypothetical protein [Cyclobacteriaceae bacterium]